MTARNNRVLPQLLVLFSRPRTGTNYLIDLFSQMDGVIAKSEVFHMNRPYGLAEGELVAIFGRTVLEMSHKERASLCREHWKQVLNYFHQRAVEEEALVVFKVFPRHLPDAAVKSILADERILPIVVDREILPSYVSARKANKLGQWDSVDTTGMTLQLEPANFIRWYEAHLGWYRLILDAMPDEALRVLFYGRFTGGGDEDNVSYVANTLKRWWPALPLSVPPRTEGELLKKQDRNERLSTIVTNLDDFLADERLRDFSPDDTFIGRLGRQGI